MSPSPLAQIASADRMLAASAHAVADQLDGMAQAPLRDAVARAEQSALAVRQRLSLAVARLSAIVQGVVDGVEAEAAHVMLALAENVLPAPEAAALTAAPLLGVVVPQQPMPIQDAADPDAETPLRPLTPAEAETAWREAPEVHCGEDRVKEIVAFVLDGDPETARAAERTKGAAGVDAAAEQAATAANLPVDRVLMHCPTCGQETTAPQGMPSAPLCSACLVGGRRRRVELVPGPAPTAAGKDDRPHAPKKPGGGPKRKKR